MDIYKKIIKDIWKKEREQLKEEIKKNGIPVWLNNKIRKTIERTSLDKYCEAILKKNLLNYDDITLTFLMKDPKRQNIYEKIFKMQIENHFEKEIKNNLFKITKLNGGGSKALYLSFDAILSGKRIKNKQKELKSLDFAIEYKGNIIYIVHKYTNENGGAQDNQRNDVIIQLNNLGPNTKNKIWFCLDGDYYNTKKIQELKNINSEAIILNLEKVINKLKTL